MNNLLNETNLQLQQNGDDELRGKYLTFWTDGQFYGISIADVVQIIGMQSIISIPEYPAYAKGIINLRGAITPVIDIRLRLGKPEADYNDRTCIIVTSIGDSFMGIIVDAVNEVTSITDDLISVPPQVGNDPVNRYLTGVARLNEKLILLIDSTKLLAPEEFNHLSQAAQK